MTEPIDSIIALFTDWRIDSFLILIIVVFPYLSAVIKYYRMFHDPSNTIHIAPITIKGKISKWLGPEEAGLILREHLSTISETFRRARSGHTSHYMDQVLGTDLLSLFSKSVGVSTEVVPKETDIPNDLVLTGLGFTVPIGLFARFYNWVSHKVPIPYRKRYLNTIIHISLVSHCSEALVHVYLGEHSSVSSPNQQSNEENARVRTETKKVRNYKELKDLLREAAFYVLELDKKSFPGRDGRSIRCLADGLLALDEYRRTGKKEKLIRAKDRFSQTDAVLVEDHPTLYFYGCLFLVDRTQESILLATELFTRALKSKKPELKALCHVGLANCFAQGVHRLASKKEDLKDADSHLKIAKREWENKVKEDWEKKAKEGWEKKGKSDWEKTGKPEWEKKIKPNWRKKASENYHTWIIVTSALLNHVDEDIDNNHDEVIKRFIFSAKMYLKAIELEPENGTLCNNLGYVLLKLAQWGAKPLNVKNNVPSKLCGFPAENAEKYFTESIRINNKNKLSYANLCLLYATSYYRLRKKKDRKKYLERCRFYGQKAIVIDPNYINGHRDLALSLLLYNQFEEAHEHYEEALWLSKNIKKDQEIMHDTEVVLQKVHVDKQELNRWLNPDPRLLSPPEPDQERPPSSWRNPSDRMTSRLIAAEKIHIPTELTDKHH